MAARESAAVERAVVEAIDAPSLSEVARRHDIAVSTLRRALRRRGQPPRPMGRFAVQREAAHGSQREAAHGSQREVAHGSQREVASGQQQQDQPVASCAAE